MSIPDTFSFDKDGEVVQNTGLRRYFLTAVIVMVALLSFGVGRLTGSREEGVGVSINFDPSALESSNSASSLIPNTSPLTPSSVSASNQGTRYYYSHCGNSISEKNRVVFASAVLAEEAGYTLAKNCVPK